MTGHESSPFLMHEKGYSTDAEDKNKRATILQGFPPRRSEQAKRDMVHTRDGLPTFSLPLAFSSVCLGIIQAVGARSYPPIKLMIPTMVMVRRMIRAARYDLSSH